MPIGHRLQAMDLRRLRTFVAVAELGTVSKAALRLRIGQPALSRQISDLQRELESIDRNRPVVFYCRSGSRSAMATQAFRQAGFDAHNMTGGLLEWEAAGLPLDPADGYVAPS